MTVRNDDLDDVFNAIETTLVKHAAFVSARRRVNQLYRRSQVSSEPVCLPIHGESRTGKTRVIEELLLAHPPVRDGDGLRTPILHVNTPSEPTVMGLAELMLSKMGDRRYYIGTKYRKTNRLIKLMKEADTRVVSIDEFQHFVDKMSFKVLHHVADWLKNLVEEAKVGLIVAGLPRCQVVIKRNEQLRGRFLAPAVMPRFDWSKKASRNQFVGVLAAFHESMSRYLDVPRFDSESMAFRIYVGSGGLIGYVAKFLNQLVWNVGESGKTVVTLADLHRAHSESVITIEGDASPRPFSKNFDADPEKESVLELARQVGAESVPAPTQSRKSKKAATSKSPSMNTVLST